MKKKLPISQLTDNPLLRCFSYLTNDKSLNCDEKLKRDHSSEDHSTNIQKIYNQSEEDVNNINNENFVGNDNKEVANTTLNTFPDSVLDLISKTSAKLRLSESLFGSSVESLSDTVLDSDISSVLTELNDESFSLDENDEILEVIDTTDLEDQHEVDLLDEALIITSDHSFLNCSTSTTASANDFFSNPNTKKSSRTFSHSMIEKFMNSEQFDGLEEVVNDIVNKSILIELSKNEHFTENKNPQIKSIDFNLNFVDDNDDSIIDISDSISIDQNDEESERESKNIQIPISASVAIQTSADNFKNSNEKKLIRNLKIQINLEIDIAHGIVCVESDTNNESVKTLKDAEDSLNESQLKTASQIDSKIIEESMIIEQDSDKKDETDNFTTPSKDKRPVINEEIQDFLNEIYGNTWKTPEMMKNFNVRNYRKELRKSIAKNILKSYK